jgi:hypothetical protein
LPAEFEGETAVHRTFAILAAIALTTLSVTSACFAHVTDGISFTLRPDQAAGQVQLNLRTGRHGRNNGMSSSFRISDLTGLDAAQLRAGSRVPIRFALIRDAGRVDCAGNALRARADGSCRFTENRAFSDLLAARGMQRPNNEQAYGLTMVGATRSLLDALHANRYPMPKVDDYIAMTAVGVTPRYIRDLAAAGYRPDNSQRLIEFAALGVTPEYLGALARAGYANLPQHRVIELAALDIDPEFIRSFERLGYRNLPVDTLVQLKALDVTPEFVRSLESNGIKAPSAAQLVKLKAIGFEPGRR